MPLRLLHAARIAFFTAALCAPLAATADLAFIARCGEPVGVKFEQVEGDVKQQPDGFAGINPTFIVTTDAPRRLTFLWGPAAWARDAQKLVENLRDADIVYSSPEHITAVRVEPPGIMQVYSLYPPKGVMFFSQHRMFEGAPDKAPAASTVWAKCEFSN
jgi:hypothetical protein